MAGYFRERERRGSEIPTTSMADVAFLLLIFFLVATTIDVDSGIGMRLPPARRAGDQLPQVHERDLLQILVRSDGSILVEGRPTRQVRAEVLRHLTNAGKDSAYAISPAKAVVSLQTERQTEYRDFVEVLDEVWMAYRTLWDADARGMGFRTYQEYQARLSPVEPDVIRSRYTPRITFADPDTSRAEVPGP